MADELVTYELNGKQFQVRVPKGSDDDFVHKAAQLHYNTKYATESGPSLPTINPPDLTQTPEFKKQDKLGSQGFLPSLGNSLSDIGSAIVHPLDTINASMPQGSNLSADSNEREKQLEESMKFPGSGAFYKATHGNISGAVGDILPQAVITALSSPKIRAGLGGVGKGIMNADYPPANLSRLSVPGVVGGGIAAATGKPFWEGAGIGVGGAAAAKSIPPMLRSIGEEVPAAMEGKPWLPIKEPNYNINKPHPVDISNSTPGRNMPPGLSEGERFNVGGQPHSI